MLDQAWEKMKRIKELSDKMYYSEFVKAA
jgi:hypothetical protein